jgi:predicted nucleic acid-binding protein
MDTVLIDSDVILDFFFDRKPFSEHASIVLSLCELNKIKGYVTPVIISNVYYILRQTASHEEIIGKLRLLLGITDVLVIDKESIIVALNSEFKDFEDALQNFAAEGSSEISMILTRNIKDYKKSKLAVFTPENYLRLRQLG